MRTRKTKSLLLFVAILSVVIGITSMTRLQSAGASTTAGALNAQQQSWSATGSLSVARSLHTATPLANGKTLVVGGINVINPCCTNTGVAELYDPATGQWSATGSPSGPRSNHVAARLRNGKVLIAGGNGDPFSALLKTVEIYNPDTGAWSPANDMNVARQSPKAMLLADGRVLVTGGVVSGGFTNTAEVYDAATNTWTPTNTMNSARVLHTVTLLSNGKVLAAGGSAANFNPIQQGSAEIYDPATNAWTPTGELTTRRITHSAILLANGKALISGGGAGSNGPIVNNAELYDPATGQWSQTGGLTTPRVNHSLTLLPNGNVLAAGGASATAGGLLRSSELYDPGSGGWTAGADLNSGRQNHTATLLSNGKLLVVGGSGGGQLNSAELYDSGAAALASVSAANYSFGVAPESIVAAFGSNLATTTQAASSTQLPTTLAGVSVRIVDAAGVERLAPLFIVTPSQINYQMPPGAAAGPSLVAVTSGGNFIAGGVAEGVIVAPGLFSADASGQGVAAALVFRRKGNGAESYEPVARFDSALNRFVAAPIDLGPESDQVFLILYGTGVRFRSALSAVSCAIGALDSEVLFADAAPGYVGLDQINVRLSRALTGRGVVDVALSVEGKAANIVRIGIQ